MILPGNSRQVIVAAIDDSPIAPHATTSKIVNDLADAGYGIIHRDELTHVLTGLLSIIHVLDKNAEFLTDMDVAKATALRQMLAD